MKLELNLMTRLEMIRLSVGAPIAQMTRQFWPKIQKNE